MATSGRFLRLRQRLGQPEDHLLGRDAQREAEVAPIGADTRDDPETRLPLTRSNSMRPAVVSRAPDGRSRDTGSASCLVAEEIAGLHRRQSEIRVGPCSPSCHRIGLRANLVAKQYPSRSRARRLRCDSAFDDCASRLTRHQRDHVAAATAARELCADRAGRCVRRCDQRVQLGARDADLLQQAVVRVHQRPEASLARLPTMAARPRLDDRRRLRRSSASYRSRLLPASRPARRPPRSSSGWQCRCRRSPG